MNCEEIMPQGKIEVLSRRRGYLKSAFATDFRGNVRVFLGIQLTKYNRFDCEIVLKYYSNLPILFRTVFAKFLKNVSGTGR